MEVPPLDADSKTALLKVFLQYADNGKFLQVIIALIVLNLPSIIAWITDYFTDRKIERLNNARISDKDSEIKRLAARIKELENLTLKNKRP